MNPNLETALVVFLVIASSLFIFRAMRNRNRSVRTAPNNMSSMVNAPENFLAAKPSARTLAAIVASRPTVRYPSRKSGGYRSGTLLDVRRDGKASIGVSGYSSYTVVRRQFSRLVFPEHRAS